MSIDKLKRIKEQVETSMKILSKERDALRDLLSKIEDLEWNVTEGVDCLSQARDELQGAVEKLSEIV